MVKYDILVKEEYIDDYIEETGAIGADPIQWSCIEFDDVAGPRRFISFQCERYSGRGSKYMFGALSLYP